MRNLSPEPLPDRDQPSGIGAGNNESPAHPPRGFQTAGKVSVLHLVLLGFANRLLSTITFPL